MTHVTHPPKEAVREYMRSRANKEGPPPTPEQIKRALGWRLVPDSGLVPEVKE